MCIFRMPNYLWPLDVKIVSYLHKPPFKVIIICWIEFYYQVNPIIDLLHGSFLRMNLYRDD